MFGDFGLDLFGSQWPMLVGILLFSVGCDAESSTLLRSEAGPTSLDSPRKPRFRTVEFTGKR